MTGKRFRQVLHWGTKMYRTGCGREGNHLDQFNRNGDKTMTAKQFGSVAALYATYGTMNKGGPCRQHEDDQANREHHILRRSRFDRKRYAIFRG